MLRSTDKGSFVVQILDQQYYSWQGTITWLADNERKSFRSLLELIKLIDEGLEGKQEQQ
jgi:hypothetical protein